MLNAMIWGMFCFVLLMLWGSVTQGAVLYQNHADEAIKGLWTVNLADEIELADRTFALDLDGDNRDDLQLTHGYVSVPTLISPEATPYIEGAQTGLRQILRLLAEIRTLSLDAANAGVNDNDDLARAQSAVGFRLQAIGQISTETRFRDAFLLDGSSGVFATASDSRVKVLRATQATQPGVYSVYVEEPAERAIVLASEAQTVSLSQDETLTVNGVSIELFAGLSATQVRDRVNDFASQTGVLSDFASAHPGGGEGAFTDVIRMYSVDFGSRGEIEVISNRRNDGSGAATGLGVAGFKDFGRDVVATIDGITVNGRGTSVIAGSTRTAGLGISIRTDPFNVVTTFSGDLGHVTVRDNSLTFPAGAGSGQVRLTLPNVQPDALGLGIENNRFATLNEIDVTSEFKAQETLEVVDASVDHIQKEIERLSGYLEITAPRSQNHFVGLFGAKVLARAGEMALLQPGETVGPDDMFWSGGFELGELQTGYIGVEIPTESGVNYGWVGVSTDHELGIVVRDYAFETTPGKAIRVGSTSDFPNSFDLNSDGEYDVHDLDLLTTGIHSATDFSEYDLNGDGILSESDVAIWRKVAATRNGFPRPYPIGDLNLDGQVNASDLSRLGVNWQRSIPGWSNGDLVFDGEINLLDLNELGQHWLEAVPHSSTTAVPEPGGLGGMVCFGLALVSRRPRGSCRPRTRSIFT